jgi:hypothetical protein
MPKQPNWFWSKYPVWAGDMLSLPKPEHFEMPNACFSKVSGKLFR